MTIIVTAPKANIPIGTVTVGGATYDVATHPEFVRFFESVLRRVGGVTGTDTRTLEAMASQALAQSFSVRKQPNVVRGGDFVTASATPGGAALDVDLPSLALALRAFAPKLERTRPVDDAEAVIAQKVYARH